MSRRILTVSLVLCAALAVGYWAAIPGERVTERAAYRNVLLISLDTLRSDHLSFYGYRRQTSPCLQRLAEVSVIFEESFANAPWTLPSHLSMFTSLYPSEHGVVDRSQTLAGGSTLLAETLKEAGYATAAFTAGYLVSAKYGFGRGFDVYQESYPGTGKRESGQGWRILHLKHNAIEWMADHADQPFFLFLHSYDTHEPFLAHEFLPRFEKDYSGPFTALNNHAAFRGSDLHRKHFADLRRPTNINTFYRDVVNKHLWTPDDWAYIRALYDNEIRFVDDHVCEILDELKSLGLADKTIVILTSDHGEELGERGKIQHGGSLHEELLRVPLVIKIPGQQPGRSKKLAQGIDLAPTVLELLRLPADPSFHGRSLFPLDAAGNDFVLAQFRENLSVRTATHKAIFQRKRAQLYDVRSDPGEKVDIASLHPERVAALERMGRAALAGQSTEVKTLQNDPDHEKALRALGYVE